MSGRARDGSWYTTADAAELLGVTERTVKRWRARGWLVNHSDGTLDREATARRVNASRDPTLGGRADRPFGGAAPVRRDGEPDPAGRDNAKLLKARIIRETLTAKALRLEIDLREGRLVDLHDCQRTFVAAITEIRTRIEAIPYRVAAHLVGMDEPAIREALREEVQAALRGADTVPRIEPNGDQGTTE